MSPADHWSFRCSAPDVDVPRIVREAAESVGHPGVVVEVERYGHLIAVCDAAFARRWRAAELPHQWQRGVISWDTIGSAPWCRPGDVPDDPYYWCETMTASDAAEQLRRAEAIRPRTAVRVYDPGAAQ